MDNDMNYDDVALEQDWEDLVNTPDSKYNQMGEKNG